MAGRMKTYKNYKTPVVMTEIDTGKYLVVGVLNRQQLKEMHDLFEPYARSWRGSSQALAKAIVSAYRKLGGTA